MCKERSFQFILVVIALFCTATSSYAGSDRLIMTMSAKRMVQEDLVYVRFLGPDGAALESNVLKQVVIREQDCSNGRILKIVDDYKIGYAPKNMLVGLYLLPHAWKNKPLCFTFPGLGMLEQSLDPAINKGRLFQFNVGRQP